jgi:hypothetical protein
MVIGPKDEDGQEPNTASALPPYDPGPIASRTAVLREGKRRKRHRPIVIPTEAEIERFAHEMHARRQPIAIRILGWLTTYAPPWTLRSTWRSIDPFTKEKLGDDTTSETPPCDRVVAARS